MSTLGVVDGTVAVAIPYLGTMQMCVAARGAWPLRMIMAPCCRGDQLVPKSSSLITVLSQYLQRSIYPIQWGDVDDIEVVCKAACKRARV